MLWKLYRDDITVRNKPLVASGGVAKYGSTGGSSVPNPKTGERVLCKAIHVSTIVEALAQIAPTLNYREKEFLKHTRFAFLHCEVVKRGNQQNHESTDGDDEPIYSKLVLSCNAKIEAGVAHLGGAKLLLGVRDAVH